MQLVLVQGLLLLLLRGQRADAAPQGELQTCGGSVYDVHQFTCFDNSFLCPYEMGLPTQRCGSNCYLQSAYTCYDGQLLCPIVDGHATLRCGESCYMPSEYQCQDAKLVELTPVSRPANPASSCSDVVANLHLSSPPYENYFLSDCHSAGQVVVTSPLSDSDLTLIGPRVVFAWPAGNSGVAAYFAPSNGANGTLGIGLVNSTIGSPLGPIYSPATADQGPNGNASYGLSTQIGFNSSATLTLAILGSIRTIRDFVEGPSLLHPEVQSAIRYSSIPGGGVSISRLWLDNLTTSTMTFMPTTSSEAISIGDSTVSFDPGTYVLNASFDYPQLRELSSQQVFKSDSEALASLEPAQTDSLAFLSYDSKLLAGAWRFLTYFGRDSMISALLLQPVLSQGKGGAVEAVIAAVLERINSTDGSVCHEETIGDYATWLNLQNNVTSTSPQCDYAMIDSDYYLPVLMDQYFVQNPIGASRLSDFMGTTVSFFPNEANLTYKDMALLTAEKIVNLAAPFAAPGGQTVDNLMHLKEGQPVGQWRDSTNGIGGGRIPFDVNTALMPAALRAIGSLARAGFFADKADWATLPDQYADVWENSTLPFFEISIPEADAKSLLAKYVNESSFPGPDQSNLLDGDIRFPALALDGYNNLSKVAVMHTDTAFRLFLVNDTNDEQLSGFLNDTAKAVMWTFPAGLMTDVGMVVANPAYGGDPVYAENFTTSAYHGTVVWSFQLAMMARGLELQLSRCSPSSSTETPPAFCADAVVFCNVKRAYNTLWDAIDANEFHLSTEVWSWTYSDGEFRYIDLGALPPPPGVSPTESDIVQLWSLTFLAVARNSGFSGSC